MGIFQNDTSTECGTYDLRIPCPLDLSSVTSLGIHFTILITCNFALNGFALNVVRTRYSDMRLGDITFITTTISSRT